LENNIAHGDTKPQKQAFKICVHQRILNQRKSAGKNFHQDSIFSWKHKGTETPY